MAQGVEAFSGFRFCVETSCGSLDLWSHPRGVSVEHSEAVKWPGLEGAALSSK